MSAETNSSEQPSKDEWAKLAKVYFNLTQGPTVPPTKVLLEKADEYSQFKSASSILDNGCGPGPVTNMLFNSYGDQIASTTKLLAADFSPAMIEQTQGLRTKQIDAQDKTAHLWERLDTRVLDAQVLEGVADESFSHVLSGMMYMLVPDPAKALKATYKALRSEGVLSLSCWKSSEWMDMMNVVNSMQKEENQMRLPQAWMSTDGVQGELEKVGFRDVETIEVPTTMNFESHEGLVEFFFTKLPHLGQQLKAMSKEEVEEARSKSVDFLKSIRPEAPGSLSGVAIVAVGRK